MRRITAHMKVTTFVFILCAFAAGSVIAEENGASFSPKSTAAVSSFNLDYRNQIAARTIDQRIIDRFVSFDSSETGGSSRYSMSLDLEHEADDWNFDITVTIEF